MVITALRAKIQENEIPQLRSKTPQISEVKCLKSLGVSKFTATRILLDLIELDTISAMRSWYQMRYLISGGGV